jgi:hypothetical protein
MLLHLAYIHSLLPNSTALFNAENTRLTPQDFEFHHTNIILKITPLLTVSIYTKKGPLA